MRAVALYALAALVLIGGLAFLLGLAFPASEAVRALRISAAIAFGVQLFTFSIARFMPRERLFVGYGIGMLMRFAVLVVYAFLLLKPLGLPAAPALFGLVTFFFASTLVEPLLLKS